MKKNFTNYFFPLFILIYTLISLIPYYSNIKGEVFPFFAFNLYSRIPNGFAHYDILLNGGDKKEQLLFLKNNRLNLLQRRRYKKLLNEAIRDNLPDGKIDVSFLDPFLRDCKDVYLVIIKGDYLDAVKNNEYKIELIQKLK